MSQRLVWHDVIGAEKQQDYFQQTLNFVESERALGKTVFPPAKDVFNAFRSTEFGDVKVVILGQDPYTANYWGRTEVGNFLSGILELGDTRDWREVMREKLGEEISAAAMLAYFEPLVSYLKEVNLGRSHTLPETPEL